MKKSIIAGAGVMALAAAAMPFAGVFAADTRTATDALNVTIADTCTISTDTYAEGATGNQWGTATGTAGTDATVTNTWTVAISNSAVATSPKHSMAIMCNKSSGWILKAQNAANLTSGTNNIGYSTTAAAGTAGYYVSVAKSGSEGTISTDNVTEGKMKDLNDAAGTIFSSSTPSAAATIELTYTVGTANNTAAGSYQGNVVYTLTPNA